MDPLGAFEILEIRIGRIVKAESHERARTPAYRLWVDFGSSGIRTSSAQLTDLYSAEALVGRQIVAAVNLGPRRIGGFVSDVLVLGVPDEAGRVVLLGPEREVPIGGKVF
jgi:tRNA-binding protein